MNAHQQFFDRLGKPVLDRRRVVVAYLIFAVLFGVLTPGNYVRTAQLDGRETTEYGVGLKWLVLTGPSASDLKAGGGVTEFRPLNFAGSLLASGAFYTLLLAGWIFRYRVVPETLLKERSV